MSKIIFLDRDGVINEDSGYVRNIESFRFIDGAVSALHKLSKLGYSLIVVTNQSGIARNYFTETDLRRLHDYMLEELLAEGIVIQSVFYCPHLGSDCECRKPRPGMIEKGLRLFCGDLTKSWIVGDKVSDCMAGYNAGLRNLCYIGNSRMPLVSPESLICDDLLSFATCLEGMERR